MVSLLLLLVALVNASVILTTTAAAHAVNVFAHWYGSHTMAVNTT